VSDEDELSLGNWDDLDVLIDDDVGDDNDDEEEAAGGGIVAIVAGQPVPPADPEAVLCLAVEPGAECPVCLDALVLPIGGAAAGPTAGAAAAAAAVASPAAVFELPCGHAMHASCLAQLRWFGVLGAACPLCRAPLPPGPAQLADDAARR